MILPDLASCAVCGAPTTHLLTAIPIGDTRRSPDTAGIVAAPVCGAHAPTERWNVARVLRRIGTGSWDPQIHAEVIDCGAAGRHVFVAGGGCLGAERAVIEAS